MVIEGSWFHQWIFPISNEYTNSYAQSMIVYFPGVHERLPHNVLIRKEREKKYYHVTCFLNFLFPTLIVQRFLIVNCVFIAYLYNLTCHYRHIIQSCASLSRAIIHGILFKWTKTWWNWSLFSFFFLPDKSDLSLLPTLYPPTYIWTKILVMKIYEFFSSKITL